MIKKSLPFYQRLSLIIFFALLLLGFLLIKQYYQAKQRELKSLVPVKTAKAIIRDVPIFVSALGTVIPSNSVIIKTQVNGLLLRFLVEEGQKIKAGDLLAEIDARPFQALLLQYEGQLAHDEALLMNARTDLARYEKLWQQNSTSQQTLETQRALVKQYEGTVKTDQGLIASVKIDLDHCQITAPFDGRIGLQLINPGNFVQTSDPNGLAVLNTDDPIDVIFSIPENNVAEVVRKIYAGDQSLQADVYDREHKKYLATSGNLTLDNQINTATGTLKLKAEFRNGDHLLFPNQFVNINLLIDTLKNAVVIPTAAIQYNATGAYVYALNHDQTVTVKSVQIAATINHETAITEGIHDQQSVVVAGVDKLTDGAKIRLTDR